MAKGGHGRPNKTQQGLPPGLIGSLPALGLGPLWCLWGTRNELPPQQGLKGSNSPKWAKVLPNLPASLSRLPLPIGAYSLGEGFSVSAAGRASCMWEWPRYNFKSPGALLDAKHLEHANPCCRFKALRRSCSSCLASTACAKRIFLQLPCTSAFTFARDDICAEA